MDITNISPTDLLPHRGPMLLVEEVLAGDTDFAEVRATVRSTWPLVRNGRVHPLALLELAAQTAGVCNGWERIRRQGIDSDKSGWLVGIKKAEFFTGPLQTGCILTARAENTFSFESLREVACTVHRAEKQVAKAVLQLFQA